MRRSVVLGVFSILSAFVILLIAGHGPWAGHTIWVLDDQHGLNSGDVPILAAWAVASAGCGYLWWTAKR